MGKLILYPSPVTLNEIQPEGPMQHAESLVASCRSTESLNPALNLQQELLLRSFVGAILRPELRESVLRNDPAIGDRLPVVILPALGGIVIDEELVIEQEMIRNFATVKRDRRMIMIPPAHTAPLRTANPSVKDLWHLDSIGVGRVNDTLTGGGVRVGVVDTGIDVEHPVFRKPLGGFAKIGEDGLPDPEAEPGDVASHGTNVCGLIGGEGIGVAPAVTLVVVQALNRWCEGWPCSSLGRIATAIDWLLCKGIDVLNLSVGEYGYEHCLYDECERARAKGVLVVAAIGNMTRLSASPANYDLVVGVGGLSKRDRPASFSSRETVNGFAKPDLYAPGFGLCSASPGGGFDRNLEGTSLASAIATGAAALLLQRERLASNAVPDLATILTRATRSLAPPHGSARTIHL